MATPLFFAKKMVLGHCPQHVNVKFTSLLLNFKYFVLNNSIELQCPNPGPIANGRIDYSSTAMGATVTYYCNQNYVLSGPSYASCLQDGTWSQAPVCTLPMCATPPPVPNAVLAGTTGQMPGSTATYSCMGQYVLEGPDTITCLENGTWSDFTGCCVLNSKCDQPPAIANGRVQYNNLEIGATATYLCNSGYQLVGNCDIQCGNGGKWIGEIPKCDIGVTCQTPGKIANGQVYYASLTPTSIAVYTCNPGFSLNGQQIVFCQNDGTWSYAQPSCTGKLMQHNLKVTTP